MLAVILLLVFAISKLIPREPSVAPSEEYLISLESGDVDAVNKEVRAVHDRVNKELGLDEASEVWVELEDCVFMGDSRVVGYEAFEFVPSDRVFAFAGAHITDARDSAEKVGSMRPEIIFVAYGLNDIGIGLWPKAEDYAAETVKTIEALQAASPGSVIVVSSVLPAVGPGLSADPNYPRIPEYNDALAAALKDMKGVVYADCTEMAKENENLYAQDGLHLQQDMYPLWVSTQYRAYEERS
ncbi:MAG: SGNH/GDSL hydrolase family protein [Eggerthellaceae bacterium]